MCQTNKMKKAHYVITIRRKKKKETYVRVIVSEPQIFKPHSAKAITLPKRFLSHNKTLNYFKTEKKLYHHDLKLLRMKCDKLKYAKCSLKNAGFVLKIEFTRSQEYLDP